MTFLAMIIAMIILQSRENRGQLHRDNWFRDLQSSVRGLGLSPTVGLVLFLTLPVLVTQFVLGILEPLLFGLLWIMAAVWVLLYCFGRVDFRDQADRYRSACLAGDFETAWRHAQSDWGARFSAEDLARPVTVNRAMQRELLYLGYQRWFAILFYFVLLGPAGALFYRLLQLCKAGPEQELVARVLFYLDWIPVRLLAVGFSLTGDFLRSRDELLASVSEPDQSAGEVLLAVGRAAVNAPELEAAGPEDAFHAGAANEIADLGGLLSRSAGAWLLLIALLVLLA